MGKQVKWLLAWDFPKRGPRGSEGHSQASFYNVYRDEWGTVYQQTESSWPIDAPIDYPKVSRPDFLLAMNQASAAKAIGCAVGTQVDLTIY